MQLAPEHAKTLRCQDVKKLLNLADKSFIQFSRVIKLSGST